MTWIQISSCSLKMNTQELILIFLLPFQVVIGQTEEVFARAGDKVTLRCRGSSCSDVKWSYSRDRSGLVAEVKNGKVLSSSPRSQRLGLNADCSLIIERLTADDAGFFVCDHDGRQEVNIVLTVMTLTQLPPEDSSTGDSHVFLKCSLACYPGDDCKCLEKGLRWKDEEGKELSASFTERFHCASFLKVSPDGDKKKYTCRYEDRQDSRVRAQHTATFSKGPSGGLGDSGGSGGLARAEDRNLLVIVIAAAVGVLTLMLVVVAVVLVKSKARRNARQDRDFPKHQEDNNATYAGVAYDHKTGGGERKDGSPEECESGVTYATVNLKKKTTKKEVGKKQTDEDVVTYAAVKTAARTPPEHNVGN